MRREEGRFVYLSQPRSGSAAVPGSRRSMAGLKAYGNGELSAWTDHRGVAVAGVTRDVAGSQWTVAAQIDLAELNRPLRRLGWQMALLLALIVAINAAAAGLVWRGRQLRTHRDREEWLRRIANYTPAYLWTTTAKLETSFINLQLARFLGVEQARFDGDWSAFIHPDDRARVVEMFEKCQSQAGEVYDEYRLRRCDGEYRWMAGRALPRRGPGGEFAGYAGSLTDVTGRREAEQRLREANAALATELRERTRSEQTVLALTARLIHAQEEERTRLARDLHDDLSQQIAAVSIAVGNMKKKIPPEAEEALDQNGRIRRKLVLLAETIRRLSHQLHPSVLEHAGLAAALRNYCVEYASLTSHRIAFHQETSGEAVSSAAALCVYRVAQEALQNSVKHAHADVVEVRLYEADGALCLEVADRGIGMNPESVGTPGLGLVSVRERARLVRGTVEIKSAPGQGTTLTLRVPLPAPDAGGPATV